MAWLEELINNAIAGQDREIRESIDGIAWAENLLKERRDKLDVAVARKQELVASAAKLYPKPRVWESVEDIPEGVVALEAEGPCRLAARRKNGQLEVVIPNAMDTNWWINLGRDHREFRPFTEVLDGDK